LNKRKKTQKEKTTPANHAGGSSGTRACGEALVLGDIHARGLGNMLAGYSGDM